MRQTFRHVLPNKDPVPQRLRNMAIEATLTDNQLTFRADLPDDPTPQELGYFKWFIGEVTDKIKEKIPHIGDMIGPYPEEKPHGKSCH